MQYLEQCKFLRREEEKMLEKQRENEPLSIQSISSMSHTFLFAVLFFLCFLPTPTILVRRLHRMHRIDFVTLDYALVCVCDISQIFHTHRAIHIIAANRLLHMRQISSFWHSNHHIDFRSLLTFPIFSSFFFLISSLLFLFYFWLASFSWSLAYLYPSHAYDRMCEWSYVIYVFRLLIPVQIAISLSKLWRSPYELVTANLLNRKRVISHFSSFHWP